MDIPDAAFWAFDEAHPEPKRRLLGDLAELLTRHACHDKSGFSFHDPALLALPTTLGPATIDRIARRVGPVLLDEAEPADVRATAAFVLGKAYIPYSLATIARAVSPPTTLATEAGRQCGFAFDVLWQACGPGAPPVDLDAMAAGFKALGVLWDDAERRVAADEL